MDLVTKGQISLLLLKHRYFLGCPEIILEKPFLMSKCLCDMFNAGRHDYNCGLHTGRVCLQNELQSEKQRATGRP